MRYMMIQKSDKNRAADVMPREDLLSAMGRRNAELPKGGVTQSGEVLRLTSKGARVTFSGGKPTVLDEPFTEAKEVVAGFAMIDAASKEDAVNYVKRSPALALDGAGDVGDVEVEIREAGCPGGVAGVHPSSPPSSSAPAPGSGGADLTRFAILLKATEHTEAGFVANENVLAAMSKRNEEAVRAGVMLAGEGLKPSSSGARVKLSRGNLAVLDGPFAEAKELIAGFWLIQVKSREEAVEWVKQYPYPLGPDGEGEVEIREVFEPRAPRVASEARGYLLQQFETAWALTSYHLDGLTTEECLWRPAHAGLHVVQASDGTWRAEWPEHEGYDLGPPSIAWVTWHLGFWWSMVLDHSFGNAALTREGVMWPGTADGVRELLGRLQGQWRAMLEQVTDDDLRSTQRTRWPFQDRPFGDVIAWATLELTKNAAEIGYARFLYAVSVKSS